MLPRITHVKYIKDFWLVLTFSDGTEAEVDFRDRIMGRGGVFTELENLQFFSQVSVDPEAKTLVWPNGVDFCPDVLYTEVTGEQLPLPQPI